MTQIFDLDAAIAQAVEAERLKQRAEKDAKQKEAAEQERRELQWFQQSLNEALAPEIQQQLGLEIKKLKFGFAGVFQLIDERDQTVSGYISLKPVNWKICVPQLDRPWQSRTIHDDGSGGLEITAPSIGSDRQILQQKLLYTLGLWREKVAELKVKLQEQGERDRQREEERQREAAEREKQQIEQAALKQRLEELHKQIEPQVKVLIEQCHWEWPQDRTLTIYQWEWCKGHFTGEFGDGGEYETAYSLKDSLGEDGYFDSVTGDRIKLIPAVHKPVVRQLTWQKVEDLPTALLTTHHFHIQGVQWRNGLMRYATDGSIPCQQKVPVEWVQALLDTGVVKGAAIFPPPGFDPTQFPEEEDYDSIPF